jgi:hypothetical protein
MSVVTFENVGQGREVAKLGSIEIGYVMAIDWGPRPCPQRLARPSA